MNKIKKWYVSCIVMAIVVLVIFLALRVVEDRNIEKNKESSKTYESDMDKRQIDNTKTVKKRLNESVKADAFSYIVNNVEFTKSNKGYKPPEGLMPLQDRGSVELDENNTILNAYTYVIVNFTIKNMIDTPKVMCAVNVRLRVEGKSEVDIENVGEFLYFGTNEPVKYGKEYGLIDFGGDEEKELVMIYVIDDGNLDKEKIYLNINPKGGYEIGHENEIEQKIWIN